MKNNLPWFRHDNDASRNGKMKALRAVYGWEAVGRFWALNEMICEAENCKLDLSKKVDRAGVAEDLGLSLTSFEELVTFMSDEEECGLIECEEWVIWTRRTRDDLVSRVEPNRKRARERYQNNKAGNDQEKPAEDEFSKEGDFFKKNTGFKPKPDTQQQRQEQEQQQKQQQEQQQQQNINKQTGASQPSGPRTASPVTVVVDFESRIAEAIHKSSLDFRVKPPLITKFAEILAGSHVDNGFPAFLVSKIEECKPKNPAGMLRVAIEGGDRFGWVEEYQRKKREREKWLSRLRTCPKCGERQPLAAHGNCMLCGAPMKVRGSPRNDPVSGGSPGVGVRVGGGNSLHVNT